MDKRQYTNDELNQFEIFTDDLIRWMFSKPNDRHTILSTIKLAHEFGETECCNKLLEAFNIESVPSNVDTPEKIVIYIKHKLKQKKE